MQQAATLRPVTEADCDKASSLLERFFAEEGFQASPEQIRARLLAMLEDEGSAVFLAWLDGGAVGVAAVTTSQGIELGLSAELEDLYVLPEARDRGAGSALIQAVKDWCRGQGCTLVSIVVTPEGQAAHNLLEYYRARGFEETGRAILFAYLDA